MRIHLKIQIFWGHFIIQVIFNSCNTILYGLKKEFNRIYVGCTSLKKIQVSHRHQVTYKYIHMHPIINYMDGKLSYNYYFWQVPNNFSQHDKSAYNIKQQISKVSKFFKYYFNHNFFGKIYIPNIKVIFYACFYIFDFRDIFYEFFEDNFF